MIVAGLAAADELARLLPDPSNGDIVLIDEDNFLLFTPMLTEAAGGELDSRQHGGIKVDACCQVSEHPGVWSLGDCAEIARMDGSGAYAPAAQNVSREGEHVAHNIVASFHGLQARPFKYTPAGELALVGRHSGAARVYGQNFSRSFGMGHVASSLFVQDAGRRPEGTHPERLDS